MRNKVDLDERKAETIRKKMKKLLTASNTG
jgi:hypothetical protein